MANANNQSLFNIHVGTQEPIRASAALMHYCMVTRVYNYAMNFRCRNRDVPNIMCTFRSHSTIKQVAHHLPNSHTRIVNGKCYVRIRADTEHWQNHLFANQRGLYWANRWLLLGWQWMDGGVGPRGNRWNGSNIGNAPHLIGGELFDNWRVWEGRRLLMALGSYYAHVVSGAALPLVHIDRVLPFRNNYHLRPDSFFDTYNGVDHYGAMWNGIV